jgi:2-methylcitrate dehydratase PrpD
MARGVALQCGFDYRPDGSMLHAQMSLRYCLAVAFLDGEVLPRQFLPARTAAEDAVRLAQRIELVDDAELDGLYPRHFAGWVEVETAAGSGRFERNFVLEPSGSHINAGKSAAMREKATRLLAEAYTPEQMTRLDNLLARIEDRSAAELLAGLHKI